MNLDSNSLLAVMLASYAIPIWIVWHNYRMSKSTSISQIICRNQTIVIASMAVMAAATCAYEHKRVKHAHPEDVHLHYGGFACIVTLLFCIFSLVSIDETFCAPRVCRAGVWCNNWVHLRARHFASDPRVCGRGRRPVRGLRPHHAPAWIQWRHILGRSGIHWRIRPVLFAPALHCCG